MLQAEANPRKMVNYDMRTSPEDGSQRMLNAMLLGTEVAVHHHTNSYENVILITGKRYEILYEETENGKQYVEDYLMNIISGLNISVGDAYRSIYGTELYENVSEERPLSKFKRDILSELGILDLFSTKL